MKRATANSSKRAAGGTLVLAALAIGLFPSGGAQAGGIDPRPADWISHSIPMRDTRDPLPRRQRADAEIEVIELPFPADHSPTGVLLMIPGFFQNAASFDLLPEKNVSIARALRDRFALKVYLLNVRGLGNSSRARRLRLDDFAIDDIPAALRWVAEREKTKVIVFGHSQGAMMVQASFAGLDRCGTATNCFRTETANLRQNDARGLAISGSNVALTTTDPRSGLERIGKIGRPLKSILHALLDRIGVKNLTRSGLLRGFAYLKVWEFLYHRANVSREAELALYQRTIEGSWSGVITDYIDGIHDEGLKADGSGERYADALEKIRIPAVSVAYGLDPLAEPEPTRRDSFARLGSAEKQFYVCESQGHEDFMMVESMHADWDAPTAWLLGHSSGK